MSKIITIDNNRYVLPEAMTTKEVQALAGFLVTLTRVDHVYNYDSYDRYHYATEGVQVGISEVELMTKAEAQAKSDDSKAKSEAKKAAEKAAA